MKKLVTVTGKAVTGKDLTLDIARNLALAGLSYVGWNLVIRAVYKKAFGIKL